MKRFALAMFVLLTFAGIAPAQCGTRFATACRAPAVVVTPHASYGTPYVAPHVYHDVAPYAVAVPVYQNPYIFSALNEDVIADAATWRAYKQLKAELAASRAPAPLPPVINPIPAAPQNQAATPKATSSLYTPVNPALTKVVADSCAKCHNSSVHKKSVDLSDLTRVSETVRARALYVVSAKQMPLDESGKVSHPLPDDQLELFAEWYHDAMVAKE